MKSHSILALKKEKVMFEKKYQINFLCIVISTALMGMDQPPFSTLHSSKKPSISINWDDNEAAFRQLTENNSCVLRTLICQEQKGTYCPDLYKAQKPLTLSLSSGYTHWSFNLDSDIILFVRQVEDKYTRYNKLISILSYEYPAKYIEDLPIKLHSLLEKNRYIANTYGSCEPYQDRIITPLHFVLATYADKLVSDFCTLSFCNLLLRAGANPNARDDVGNTPMHHASTPEQVGLLCEYGAKINKQGYEGRTPLINGIRLCNWPVVHCLLQHNANPNKKDVKGKSPLRMAIKKNSLETVKLLLDHRADWSQEKFSGICPLYIYFPIENHIKMSIKELLQENNLDAIKKLIHTPSIHEISSEMSNELTTWIKEKCVDGEGMLFSAADALLKRFAEIEMFRDAR